jgi:ERCC4-related helicase
MFAHACLQRSRGGGKRLQRDGCPYVEIFCDPLHDYRITYHPKDPDLAGGQVKDLFDGREFLQEESYLAFLNSLSSVERRRDVVIRPEVYAALEDRLERVDLERLRDETELDFSRFRVPLYDYQKEGIRFAVFRKGALIADDMGLGKTIQAIAAAVFKKEILGFGKTLIVCPASLISQWKKEIERYTDERAHIVEGPREERKRLYEQEDVYFHIVNYETVLRDVTVLSQRPPDLIILDEAQKIKNYETKTSDAVKSIPKKHALVITGTPLENKLIELYSIMNFIDPRKLAPLWEFSMNHCLFDKEKKNKITGYYNLQELKERLKDTILRREKREVLTQLPPLCELNVPVELTLEQLEIHAGYARGVMMILQQKYISPADLQRLQKLFLMMRMVCDSTYLIDQETNFSPKLDELEDILVNKLDLANNGKKLLIFSEWRDMLTLIGHRVGRLGLGHVTLTGEVPSGKRGALIEEFSNNPDCRVFLSSEAGGAGLNLQVADTVINFDIPWNPAKKNQRIGRIDRLGQQAESLLVVNLIALNSIEARIADGITLKQDLFDAVLTDKNDADLVDFARRGKATFFTQMKDMMNALQAVQTGEVPADPPVVVAAVPAAGGAPSGEADEVGELREELAELARSESGRPAPAEPAAAPLLADAEPLPMAAAPCPPGPAGDALAPPAAAVPVTASAGAAPGAAPAGEVLERTLNQGISFLSGILQMATGREAPLEGQSVQVDRVTGEVTLKFRLPGFPGAGAAPPPPSPS